MESQDLNSITHLPSSQGRLPGSFMPPILSSPLLCQIGVMIGTYSALQFGKEACRTSPLSGRDYVAELLASSSNERRMYEVLRMPRNTFLDLKNWMVTNAGLQETKKISVDQQLVMFIAIAGHRSTNREVQERFQVSGFTVTK